MYGRFWVFTEDRVTWLPLGDRAVLVKDTRHRPGSAKGIFREAGFGDLKSEARLLRQREPSLDHAHGRKTQPLLPDPVGGSGLDLTADFLHDKVRHSGIDVQRREPTNGTLTRVRRHGNARCR